MDPAWWCCAPVGSGIAGRSDLVPLAVVRPVGAWVDVVPPWLGCRAIGTADTTPLWGRPRTTVPDPSIGFDVGSLCRTLRVLILRLQTGSSKIRISQWNCRHQCAVQDQVVVGCDDRHASDHELGNNLAVCRLKYGKERVCFVAAGRRTSL